MPIADKHKKHAKKSPRHSPEPASSDDTSDNGSIDTVGSANGFNTVDGVDNTQIIEAKIDESLENLEEKRASTREAALRALSRAFSSHYLEVYLENKCVCVCVVW